MPKGSRFGYCRYCKSRILWLKTVAGKNMPVDPGMASYREVAGGKERFVTPNGIVIVGEECAPEVASGYGYIPHFATCGKR